MQPIYIINKSCTHTGVTLIGSMISDRRNKGSQNTQLSVQKAKSSRAPSQGADAVFYFILFHSIPACCVRVCAVLCCVCWLSGVQTVMISLPPLPDRPLLWGKGWFSSSQPRALQRGWQACLSVYGMCTSACGCGRVAEAPCIKLNHMTWASPQLDQTLCVHLTHRHVSLLKKKCCSFNGALCSFREKFVIRGERSSLSVFFLYHPSSFKECSGNTEFFIITPFIL